MKKLLFLLLFLLYCPMAKAQVPITGGSCPAAGQTAINPQGQGMLCTQNGSGSLVWTVIGGSGSGISSVTSLPATCTPGVSGQVAISNSIIVGIPPITYGAGTVFYCDSTNHYSPVSQGSGASPIVGWYLSPQCPPSNAAQCFFTYANTQVDNTATWSSVSSTITTTDSPFTAADVAVPAKQLWGFGTTAGVDSSCSPYQPMPVTANLTTTNVTITAFIDANHVTVSPNPGTTFSTAKGCIIWGQPDDTGAAALDTAIQAAAQCPKVTAAAGYYLFTAPHFFTQPTGCLNLPNIIGSSRFGNILYTSGFDFEGRGIGVTTFFHPPDYPQSGACNHGTSGNACWAPPGSARFHDFAISGGGGNLGPASAAIMEIGVGSLEYFVCTNFGSSVGINVQDQAQLQQVTASNCGATGITIKASTGTILPAGLFANARGYRVTSENATVRNFLVEAGAQFTCRTCEAFGSQTSQIPFWSNQGGTIWLEDSDITTLSNPSGSTLNGGSAYNCNTTGGCVLHGNHLRINQGTLTTNVNGIFCSVTCTNYLQDSIVLATGTGAAYTDSVSTSSFIDECGNQMSGGAANAVTGKIFGTCSVTGGLLVAGNLVPSANWGTGAAISAPLGDTQNFSFTLTNGSAAVGANPTIAFTFPVGLFPWLKVPICTVQQVGGTQSILAATAFLTPGAGTVTSVTLTYNGTPTINLTEFYQGSCH
jgi:hypothetical protein